MGRHELKLLSKFVQPIIDDVKRFELRKNDRNFKVGDTVVLNEWDDKKKKYTGHAICTRITYIVCKGFGLKKGYCCFGFEIVA